MILVQLNETELKQLIKSSLFESIKELDLKSKNNTEKLLTIKEASVFLNLAQQTLYGFTSQRKIPFIKKGKKLYFNKVDLEKWLNEDKEKYSEIVADVRKRKGGKHE
jgi:excisionase family DNA binding protein